ncbi:MAG: TonB-dependent receptor [Thermoanaerobaculia bacterium]
MQRPSAVRLARLPILLAGALALGLWAGSGAALAADLVPVAGTVRDTAGAPIAGARLAALGSELATRSDADGRYRLLLVAGEWRIAVSAPGFRPAEATVALAGEARNLDFALAPATTVSEEIVVDAIRADAKTPVTKRDLDAAEIARRNYHQEMPFLLAGTPAITSYSESGLAQGGGYSYFTLRGVDQRRVNMTFDGVPLNDPEESAVYFANFGDFTSALGSIQVQRGVGTSSVGAASYGGSINFASVDLADRAEGTVEVGGGSFGTGRASASYQSGRLASGLALYGRASYQDTDGFREHSGVRQRTLYLGGTWQGSSTFVKFFGFSGRENTDLAFAAVDPAALQENLRFNPLQPEETDAYGQDLLYLQASHPVGSRSLVAAQVYYNGAQGAFKLWDDPVAKTDLRSYGLDGGTLGLLVTSTTSGDHWGLTTGLHSYTFSRDHYQTLGGVSQYRNTGKKWEVAGFAKLGVDLARRWHLYADLQVRHAAFRYDGSVDLGPIDWTFVDPKLGLRYDATDRLAFYVSVGRAGREPARNDMLVGLDDVATPIDLGAVRPERVVDYEVGAIFRTATLSLAVDLYAMEFHDEIAATGEQSALGYAIRRNLPRSHRRGLEADFAWQPLPRLRLATAIALAQNRIATWRQAIDVYDDVYGFTGAELRTFHDTQPYLSPERILHQSIDWQAGRDLLLSVAVRHVGPAYLDNTGQRALTTPSYTLVDLGGAIELGRFLRAAKPRLRLQVNNVFDNREAWASGYSYSYLQRHASGGEDLTGVPYYYPLATRHWLANLELRF